MPGAWSKPAVGGGSRRAFTAAGVMEASGVVVGEGSGPGGGAGGGGLGGGGSGAGVFSLKRPDR